MVLIFINYSVFRQNGLVICTQSGVEGATRAILKSGGSKVAVSSSANAIFGSRRNENSGESLKRKLIEMETSGNPTTGVSKKRSYDPRAEASAPVAKKVLPGRRLKNTSVSQSPVVNDPSATVRKKVGDGAEPSRIVGEDSLNRKVSSAKGGVSVQASQGVTSSAIPSTTEKVEIAGSSVVQKFDKINAKRKPSVDDRELEVLPDSKRLKMSPDWMIVPGGYM